MSACMFRQLQQVSLKFSQLEDSACQDTARQDLRCFVDNEEGHPGEAKPRNVSSNPIADPDGIHSNKDTFGKASCEALHVT